MKRKDVLLLADEINKEPEISCTQLELSQLISHGVLNEIAENTYVNNMGKKVIVHLNKIKTLKFSIDLSYLINECISMVASSKIKRVYCMTHNTYEKYKKENLIVDINGEAYFRLFDKELWKILLI